MRITKPGLSSWSQVWERPQTPPQRPRSPKPGTASGTLVLVATVAWYLLVRVKTDRCHRSPETSLTCFLTKIITYATYEPLQRPTCPRQRHRRYIRNVHNIRIIKPLIRSDNKHACGNRNKSHLRIVSDSSQMRLMPHRRMCDGFCSGLGGSIKIGNDPKNYPSKAP